MGGSVSSGHSRKAKQRRLREWKPKDDLRWGYGRERGPEYWYINYPEAAGSNQSPINIDTEMAEFDEELLMYPLKFILREKGKSMLSNTGHSWQVDVTPSSYITAGPLGRSMYILHQFHMHWGDADHCGSEHTVNGKIFAGELHLVFWNKSCGSFEAAAKSPKGLAVVAVFTKETSGHHVGQGISVLASGLRHIKHKGMIAEMSELHLRSLLPGDCSEYWTYSGSLTTPPCSETVTWIVMTHPIAISRHELSEMRNLRSYRENEPRPALDEFGGNILTNFRPVQNSKGRRVRASSHVFMGHNEFDHQFKQEGLFPNTCDYNCQDHRLGLK